ncbi:hypothetical protein LXA43DRAFT_1090970 [Ganoderma leucocontextum]|nr:hypothetical protein LXA43DRAFT_1090970 [Ganoderma leucocontextum]
MSDLDVLETRPSKRTRLSADDPADSHHPPGSSSTSSSGSRKPQRHPEIWFDDGNIVLVARETAFRIYRGLLAGQSTVFSDMFVSSTSSPDETFDGCPVVHLSDSPHDLAHLLRVLLPQSRIHYHATRGNPVRTFDEVAAVIRLAHKYNIQQVQEQALASLQEWASFSYSSPSPKPQIALKPAHNIGVVNLARLTDTPSLLPLALYRCAYLGSNVFDGWTHEDGTVEHLPEAELRWCIDTRVVLTDERTSTLLDCWMREDSTVERLARANFLRQGVDGQVVLAHEWFFLVSRMFDDTLSMGYRKVKRCSAHLRNLEHHPEFWFDDGNIVLIAQHTGFRIFRGLLAAQSTVFADMFASASSQADETLDGCPVVHLSESHLDLAHLLRILLPTSPLCYPTTNSEVIRSFNEVAAVVRLAHKYHIQSVQDQAIRALQEYPFSSDLNVHFGTPKQRISMQGAQYIGAVNLARLTDTPLMLPAALYRCCLLGGNLLDGWTHEDGTVEYLCTADIKRCFDARIALGQEQFLLLSRLFAAVAPGKCVAQGHCAVQVTSIARHVVSQEDTVKKPALYDWSTPIQITGGLCEGCKQVLLERNRVERQRIWDTLPRVFGITVEGWAKADGRGAVAA